MWLSDASGVVARGSSSPGRVSGVNVLKGSYVRQGVLQVYVPTWGGPCLRYGWSVRTSHRWTRIAYEGDLVRRGGVMRVLS